MDFSILVPTRERTNEVNRLLDSIKTTTKNPQNIEVLFACDEEDSSSINNIKSAQQRLPELSIKYFTRKRTSHINKDYYNWLATFATGDYLWISADDLRFLQESWDVMILEQLNYYFKDKPDRIACISIKDNTPKPSPWLPKFPCFPMFTKEVLKVMGFLLYPKVPTWGADYVAYQTFKPINRLLEIQDRCYLNHISYHTRAVEADGVSKRVGAIFNALKMVPYHNIQRIEKEELPGVRSKLEGYIRSYK